MQLSKLGGLTARVGQLLEVLPASHGIPDVAKTGLHDMHAVRLSMDGARELQPSRFADLVQPPRLLRCGRVALPSRCARCACQASRA